jgi:TatA/E family protein of Tat protein translocase
MGFSISHLLLIAIILAIFFFKPGNIRGLGKSIGKAIRNFKDAMNEIEVDEKDIKEILPAQKHGAEKQEIDKQSHS